MPKYLTNSGKHCIFTLLINKAVNKAAQNKKIMTKSGFKKEMKECGMVVYKIRKIKAQSTGQTQFGYCLTLAKMLNSNTVSAEYTKEFWNEELSDILKYFYN